METCAVKGCRRQRVSLSVFCEKHHLLQLASVGREKTQSRAELRRAVVGRRMKLVEAGEKGTLSSAEVCENLYTRFLHGWGMRGTAPSREREEAVVRALPAGVVAELLEFAEGVAEPMRYFQKSSIAAVARRDRENVHAAHERLLVLLRGRE